jgi:hypothetical protein
MSISLGFCIESRTDDEMPETLFGCVNLHCPSVTWPEINFDSISSKSNQALTGDEDEPKAEGCIVAMEDSLIGNTCVNEDALASYVEENLQLHDESYETKAVA